MLLPATWEYCQLAYLPQNKFVNLRTCHIRILSTCLPATEIFGQFAYLPHEIIVNLPTCDMRILSTCTPATWEFCQLVYLAQKHFVNLPTCYMRILSTCHRSILSICLPVTEAFFNLPTCHIIIINWPTCHRLYSLQHLGGICILSAIPAGRLTHRITQQSQTFSCHFIDINVHDLRLIYMHEVLSASIHSVLSPLWSLSRSDRLARRF